jgi:hypothetical protein
VSRKPAFVSVQRHFSWAIPMSARHHQAPVRRAHAKLNAVVPIRSAAVFLPTMLIVVP